jgi:hypothetical protein
MDDRGDFVAKGDGAAADIGEGSFAVAGPREITFRAFAWLVKVRRAPGGRIRHQTLTAQPGRPAGLQTGGADPGLDILGLAHRLQHDAGAASFPWSLSSTAEGEPGCWQLFDFEV